MIIILLYYTGSKNKDRVRNASAPYMKKKLLKASASDTSTSSYVESVKKKKLLNASASDTSASSYVESVKKKKLLKASSSDRSASSYVDSAPSTSELSDSVGSPFYRCPHTITDITFQEKIDVMMLKIDKVYKYMKEVKNESDFSYDISRSKYKVFMSCIARH